LHFGQISPLYVYLRLLELAEPVRKAFIDELVIRRELSMNFTLYNDHYDALNSLPAWAQATLHKHSQDNRPYVYALCTFEEAKTHDPYWNAAQMEMVVTGKMHGYMRMYWGKKILEWSSDPSEAYQTAVFLNNKYSLDGRDPNAFAGIAWCFGKHDRPWKERAIFGTIRYMSADGLTRKFDMQRYMGKVDQLKAILLKQAER
jgi:deoxyribodipyrimidine photo-lyase